MAEKKEEFQYFFAGGTISTMRTLIVEASSDQRRGAERYLRASRFLVFAITVEPLGGRH
jgi:hypothetical protein